MELEFYTPGTSRDAFLASLKLYCEIHKNVIVLGFYGVFSKDMHLKNSFFSNFVTILVGEIVLLPC